MSPTTETLSWVDAGGTTHNIDNKTTRLVVEHTGLFSMPPVNLSKQDVPFGHEQLYLGYLAQSRQINLGIMLIRHDRDSIKNELRDLSNIFNPERGLGKLEYVFGSKTCRLDCRVVGLDIDKSSYRNPTTAGALLRLVALSPFWYNTSQQSVSKNFNGATIVDFWVDNYGDAPTWPTMIVAATVNHPVIQNLTTSKTIDCNVNVTGTQLDIDCSPGVKTVKVGSSSQATLLTNTSEFWNLQKGVNFLRLSATSGTGLFSIAWYERYLML